MSDITHEELHAFTAAHEKVAVVLEKIANQLEQITIKQDKVLSKFENGMVDGIVNGVTANYNNVHKETVESLSRIEKIEETNRILLNEKIPIVIQDKLQTSSMSRDIEHTKWLVSIIGLAIIISMVVIKVLDTRFYISQRQDEIQQLEKMLKQHLSQDKNNSINLSDK